MINDMEYNVLDLIPQRYPFLMIDKIISISPGEEAVALKNVSYGESWTQGHFPGAVVMPGNLIIEAMAQTSMLMLYDSSLKKQPQLGYLLNVNKVKFRQMVRPGDCLVIKSKLIIRLNNCIQVSNKCFVNDKIIGEGELLLSIENKLI